MTAPFVISRVFDAPRDRVWKAWTDVEQVKQWWGPIGFVVTYCKLDLRPGGVGHYCLRAPDGSDMWGRFAYREIVEPERLVWLNSFSDKDGGLSVHPMMPTWPREMHTTVTFKDIGGRKTEVTVTWLPAEGSTELERASFETGRPGLTVGWSGTFEQFAGYLSKGK